MEDKKALIAQKQKELQISSLKNKILQFDIKILEYQEQIESVEKQKAICEQAIENELNGSIN